MHKTPLLRVSRPVSACSRCRSAKIKCDGKLPACTACERAGKASECSSGNDQQFARGKERSYVASLETRVERLERQLHYRQTTGQPVINIQRRPSVYPLPETKVNRKVEASDVDELVSDFGHLAVNATSNGFHGFDREMSLARLLLSTAMVSELPPAADHPLPPRPVAIELLDKCVMNFLTLCPVISYTAALGALERVYHHSRMASPQDVWNVRICLALGLCARSQAQGDAHFESAIKHVSYAVDAVGESVIAPGSLARLRGLMLLVLYSTASPAYLNSWYLMGMAARFMAEMGLHAEDKTASQERRALFLLVYGMDRQISMSRLQPFSFSDESADLDIPALLTPQDILSNKDSTVNEDFAKVFIQIQQEQSAWYQALYYTDHQAARQPYTSRLSSILRNQAWIGKVPGSATEPLRSRFLVQILYGGVLLMLPLETSQESLYGKALALEYVCAYADAAERIAGKADVLGATKNDDHLRTRLVSQRLLQLVKDPKGPVYVSAAPTAEELSMALPGLTWTTQGIAIPRVIETLRKLDGALAWLNAKYGYSAQYQEWKAESETALQMLYGHFSVPASSW